MKKTRAHLLLFRVVSHLSGDSSDDDDDDIVAHTNNVVKCRSLAFVAHAHSRNQRHVLQVR